MNTELAQRPEASIATEDEMSIEQLTGQVKKIQDAMKAVMRDNEHYGVIPGTNKPTLLKPGAEKLCLLFRLAPSYERQVIWHDDGHMTVVATCALTHIPSGNLMAEGDGMCSTRESKYAYRRGNRTCPQCGSTEALRNSKKEGEGWYCWAKIGGCGAKFDDGDPEIEGQDVGKVPNPDLPDTYNTVLKMACKRALVAAVLNGTAASDIFTQDIEDSVDRSGGGAGSGASVAPDGDAAPPTALPEWLQEMVAVFGEGEVIDAAEQVRAELGTGAPIATLRAAASAPPYAQTQIRDLLTKQSGPREVTAQAPPQESPAVQQGLGSEGEDISSDDSPSPSDREISIEDLVEKHGARKVLDKAKVAARAADPPDRVPAKTADLADLRQDTVDAISAAFDWEGA